MLSISHSLTGAFLAVKFQNPALYIPLTLAAHYLQDWIPHWDVGTGLSNGSRSRMAAFLLELIDLGLAFGLVYLLWADTSNTTLMHAGIGAFIGLVPDFMEAPRNFLKWEPFFLKPFNQFHSAFHHSTPHIGFGLLPQVLLWITIGVLR